jgi:hypothetical protein
MQELENVNALEHGTRSNEIRAAGQEAVSANHFSGSIVESTRWMVLHRPVEPAALIRQWYRNSAGVVLQSLYFRPEHAWAQLVEYRRGSGRTLQ